MELLIPAGNQVFVSPHPQGFQGAPLGQFNPGPAMRPPGAALPNLAINPEQLVTLAVCVEMPFVIQRQCLYRKRR